MIHPKLLPSQELALHRVAAQQHEFAKHNALLHAGGLNAIAGDAPSSPTASQTFSACTSTTTPIGTLACGGSNSTAPAAIARPEIRPRPEWATTLEDVDTFELPEHHLIGSVPDTRRRIAVQYIADQYDRQWLVQRSVTTSTTTATATVTGVTKGKTGSIDSTSTTPSSVPSFSRNDISISLFEDLITAFEVGSYSNPEIPVQRQPVSSFDGVVAIGADPAIVEEVRQYWLGKREALGGNVPCIPSLHMNVREDNQSSLCHADVLQYCPLPFNYRDWSIAVLQRRVPQSYEGNIIKKAPEDDEVNEDEGTEVTGRKRKRCINEKPSSLNEDFLEAEENERHTLVSCGLKVAQAVLEREEWKLTHTHLALYELALLRQFAMVERDAPDGGSNPNPSTPWVSDEALQEEWDCDDEAMDKFHDGINARAKSAALESVMAIGKRMR
ncbi:uncharacterized protein TM35_000033380 [Trypanosoma theileri]|uniref:Uncharacterized protein n=1 Tax=Trypanosoma theileri TaxID=67003 RepID=A0A1X0P6X1_9TRYP|nr:uncharacterized protein TM35_000033380 [Trypanosoma theileri]ORC92585.1 hypothetical protein TM35_000033380 [Trypanosoma theileri]